MVELSTANLIALYAPLAGLVVLAFYVGRLSEKVRTNTQRLDAVEAEQKKSVEEAVMLGRIEERLATLFANVGKVERETAGIQRQLAQLFTGKNPIIKFEQDPEG